MSLITTESVKNSLRQVVDPVTGRDVVSEGLISGVTVRGGKVGFVITITPGEEANKLWLQKMCEEQVRALPGVESVTAVLTNEDSGFRIQDSGKQATALPESSSPRKPAVWNRTPVEGVKSIIAVASGKGGVGKSTTAVNLALALTRMGKRVGLLDADIYGPSLPCMLGLELRQPEIVEGRMIPPVGYGIACMSMGFVTGEEAAVMRGPMITKTLHQLLRLTWWDNLDLLLVDMPPGTGDIHLSLAQAAPLAGVIIVTTPQVVAVVDARKCAIMFRKVEVPVLGVIENMSGGIFGRGGGRKLAEEIGAPFLGEVAMEAGIVAAGDSGAIYGGIAAKAYGAIAYLIPA